MNCETAQNFLDGYADGELDLINHLEVEKHLQNCPSCEREFQNLQTLKSAFDDSMRFHALPDLRRRIQTALRETSPEPAINKIWNWRWLAAGAASFAAVVILGLIFFQPGSTNDELLATEMVSNHVRSMMANHLTDVPSSDKHTVKPWFDGKIDFSPPVVDLAAQGYPLVGGRLDYAAGRPIAALVYQHGQHFVNLFVFPSAANSDSGNKMLVRQGYNIIHWNKAGMTFWAVSDLNISELQEFAQTIQN